MIYPPRPFRPLRPRPALFFLLLLPASASALAAATADWVNQAGTDTPAARWPVADSFPPTTGPSPATRPTTRPIEPVTADLFTLLDCRGRLALSVRSAAEDPARGWTYARCGGNDGGVAWAWKAPGLAVVAPADGDAGYGPLSVEWEVTAPPIPAPGRDADDTFYRFTLRQAGGGAVHVLRRLRTPADVPDLDYHYAADSFAELADAYPAVAAEASRVLGLCGQVLPASRYLDNLKAGRPFDQAVGDPVVAAALSAWADDKVAKLNSRSPTVRERATADLAGAGDDVALYLHGLPPASLSPEQSNRVAIVLGGWPPTPALASATPPAIPPTTRPAP